MKEINNIIAENKFYQSSINKISLMMVKFKKVEGHFSG